LIAAYETLARGDGSAALVAQLAELARREADKIVGDGWYQNLMAADTELALAAAARTAGEVARAKRAVAQALEHLERFRAITGVSTGTTERRLGWARELRSKLEVKMRPDP
jgi:precorrin-3B methylase